MGGIYQADPNLQYIGAPLSNKGNPTSQTGGNTFAVRADQPVRLVDHRTNQIVFEGTGFDAARKATELGQGLTNQFGRKANYSIQTADPTGNYSTVAYEKKNKSTLGKIANVAGTLLPLAMIPLTAGASAGSLLASTAGKIGLGTALGAAGAGLKGDNILKGAAMGGLSAAGGSLLGAPLGKVGDIGLRAGTAIGTGLGATAGGLATGQDLKSSLLGGVASGALSYVTPDIVKGLGINQAPATSTSTGGGVDSSAVYGGPNAEIIVNATPSISTPNINLGGYKTPEQKYLDDAANSEVSNPVTNADYTSGYDGDIINVTGSVPGAVTGGLNLAGLTADPVVNNTDEIVVSGTRPGAVTGGLDLGSLSPEVIPAIDGLENFPTGADQIAEEDIIKVTGQRPGAVTSGIDLGALTTTAPAVLPNDIVVDATKRIEQPASGTFMPTDLGVIDRVSGMENYKEPIVVEGSKIERPEPTSVSVMPPLEPLRPLDLKPDPALTDEKKLGLEEYLRIASLISGLVGGGGGGSGQTGTYGGGGTGRLNPIFSAKLPSAGGLGTIGANRTARPMGDVDWLTYGTRPELNFFDYAARNNPAPITTPIPNNPAGPAMYARDVDNMRFARGGAAKGGLSYEELSPEEKNFVDYHRRSLLVNPYERDGNISSVVGAVNAVPEGEMLYPTYVHGKMMDPNSARDWALRSGIDFPVYPDAETALARERMIHDNIIEPETTRYARGEREFLQERAKGGSPKRSEFAVNGPGTGRSDDIPAVLSDGEYVIDAETVALLGDGSNKAGAKKLDELRVKVRKHKGQKLAKGRFSANAKKAEAYLSGGRI
jgi:hypothetical protein